MAIPLKRSLESGSGPSGLTAAFYLRKKGHAVTVFDANRQAGGMLRYGIPRYRLPREVIDSEIGEIFNLGIDFKPNQILGKDFTIEQLKETELSFLDKTSTISVDGELIVVDPDTLVTGMERVYAGGDVTQMQGSIIHAVAAGRKAASSIDKALGGIGNIKEIFFAREAPDQYLDRDEGFAAWSRQKVPQLELEARHGGFNEVSLGYTDQQALKEAKRCLQCDLRLYLACNPSPPEPRLAFNEESINRVPEAEGVYQLLDEDHKVLTIKGTANLRKDLLEQLEENEKAVLFEFKEGKMYSQRESELIQRYLQKHGEMPGSGDEGDDLF